MKKEPKESLGDRVIRLMSREKLTSLQVAAKIDKHVTTVDRIAHSETKSPPDATLRKLANALNTSYEYLTTGEGEETVMSSGSEPSGHSLYRDYALKRLEQEADTWKEKYEQVWARFTSLLDKVPLGKFRPVKETASEAA